MSDWTFRRDAIACFRFTHCRLDPSTGEAVLGYAFDDSPVLEERIHIPGGPFILDAGREVAVQQALRFLHWVAGVSYFKAAVPATIACEAGLPDRSTADFLSRIYENGLGEFAHRNGLSLRGRIHFPSRPEASSSLPALGHDGSALVAIGGGKDSLVSIEALRRLGRRPTVTWIGSSPLIAACANRTGLPTLNITRQLAPALFDYNQQGAWNGHIPVTAVNSAILVLAALIRGHGAVVFSNEHSASYGSLIPGSGEVNHQWSKGWDFERDFAAWTIRHLAPDLAYYSLLRPWSELAVARQFARLEGYDAHFSSCNRNFHLLGERPTHRWCGQCPKCHFVFLALAPFLPKPRLLAIFGRNLLDDPGNAGAYDALMELGAHKPFECVGEGRESRAAMNALADSASWREDALVQRFVRQQRPMLSGEDLTLETLMSVQGEHGIPADLWEPLHAHFSA